MGLVDDACCVSVSYAVFGPDCPDCDRCGSPIRCDDLGVFVQHGACGHCSGYCESCGLFMCMLSDAEDGGHLAGEFVEWLFARRTAAMN